MVQPKWFAIAGTLMVGLFVSFLDRINLSVTLMEMAEHLGYAGVLLSVLSNWVMTSFMTGYAMGSFFGSVLTRRTNPKTTMIAMMALCSVVTILIGWVASAAGLVVYCFVLGVAQAIYYPQQSRFVRMWFSDKELSRANSIVNFYGQSLGFAVGYLILSLFSDAFGWQVSFIMTGILGLLVIIPLFMKFLKWNPKSQFAGNNQAETGKFSWSDLGGFPVLFLFFTFLTQASLFWGISLWIPLVVKSFDFSGIALAVFSALPFFACLVLGAPISFISDWTGKRSCITAMGMFGSGTVLLLLPFIDDPILKMVCISLSFGYNVSSFLPNILAIVQSSVKPAGVAPTVGIGNGLGAMGGVVSGYIIGWLYDLTGAYVAGYVIVGILVIMGGVSIIFYDRYKVCRKMA